MRNLSPDAAKRQQEAQIRIHAETLDRIYVTCPKGRKADYMDLANKRGVSLNRLILDLLDAEEKTTR